MSDDEWEAICTTLEECFNGDFPQRTRDNYRLFLRRFEATELLGAIAALVESGQRFLPKPGELVVEIRKVTDTPVPGWGEVWTALQRAMTVSGRCGTGDKQAAGEAWLEKNSHPVVARFYEVERYEALSMVSFFDPDYGHFRVAELKARWEEFVEVASERVRQGRALEVIGVSKGGLPRTLDEAALLANLSPEAESRALPPGSDA